MQQTFDIMAAIYEQAKLFEECVGEPARRITVSPRSCRRLLELMASDEKGTAEKLRFDRGPILLTEFGEFIISIDELASDTDVVLG